MKRLLLIYLLFGCSATVNAQVAIGAITPDVSAILEVESTTQGLIIPEFGQLYTTDKSLIPSDQGVGMMLYDTMQNNFFVFTDPGTTGTAADWVGQGGVPSGTIAMFNGTSLPAGWVLCDGANGTPDLRGHFLKGWGDQDVGMDGGLDFVTLSDTQMPSHTHTSSGGDHTHTGTSSHSHNVAYTSIQIIPTSPDATVRWNDTGGGAIQVPTLAVTSSLEDLGSISETSSVSTSVTSIANTGSGESHENRPPYYVLAFIMKL